MEAQVGVQLQSQLRSIAYFRSAGNGTRSNALLFVLRKNIRGAQSASKASSHRDAQRHQESPATRPGNLYSGRGVERSLPRPFEKRRNSLLIKAHTVCEPASYSLDRQNPSLKKPVIGLPQHSSNGSPNKFFSALIKITF